MAAPNHTEARTKSRGPRNERGSILTDIPHLQAGILMNELSFVNQIISTLSVTRDMSGLCTR